MLENQITLIEERNLLGNLNARTQYDEWFFRDLNARTITKSKYPNYQKITLRDTFEWISTLNNALRYTTVSDEVIAPWALFPAPHFRKICIFCMLGNNYLMANSWRLFIFCSSKFYSKHLESPLPSIDDPNPFTQSFWIKSMTIQLRGKY